MKSIVRGLVLLCMLIAPVIYAEVVVLQSNVARFPVGEVLADDSAIELQERDIVMLATQFGAYTVSGPHSGPFVGVNPESEQSLLVKLGDMLEVNSEDNQSMGAIRGQGDQVMATCGSIDSDPWVLVLQNGRQCARPAGELDIVRPDTSGSSRLSIRDIAMASESVVSWEDGVARATWPADVQRRDHSTYALRKDANFTSNTLALSVLPEGVISDAQVITWLNAQGCGCQALRLYRQIQP